MPPELIWGNDHYFIEISNFIEDKTTWTISFWSLNITRNILCFQVMIFDDQFFHGYFKTGSGMAIYSVSSRCSLELVLTGGPGQNFATGLTMLG